jgi:hypothetical protein
MRMKHGANSKFWHIRLVNPKLLKSMKTVTRGPIKQVVGKNKGGHWTDQNVMVKKGNAKKSGSKLIITNSKVKKALIEKGFNPSAIIHLNGGGDSDFTVKQKGKKK